MIKKILLGGVVLLTAIVVVFCIVVAMQPAEYSVVRSATIAAPPAVVFAQVNDFHKWEAWSPWAKRDPNAENSFEGPPEGEGAKFRWSGNDEVGEGQMTILESRPGELVKLDLEFVKPFADKCLTEFAFKPEGEKTVVTWSMSGKNDFMGKAICLFMDMDEMVGGSFEEGLASMKSIAEAKASEPSGPNEGPPSEGGDSKSS